LQRAKAIGVDVRKRNPGRRWVKPCVAQLPEHIHVIREKRDDNSAERVRYCQTYLAYIVPSIIADIIPRPHGHETACFDSAFDDGFLLLLNLKRCDRSFDIDVSKVLRAWKHWRFRVQETIRGDGIRVPQFFVRCVEDAFERPGALPVDADIE